MKLRKLFLAAITLVTAASLAGCGGSKTPTKDPTPEPTPSVTPSEPTVTPSPSEVAPISIALDKYELTLFIGEEAPITPTVLPTNATYTLDWKSSDVSVATVDSLGNVKAIASGKATITVCILGTNLRNSCIVSVPEGWHDYVKDGTVKLKLDYKDRDFFVDGIEQVNLLTPIDGDTAHFTTIKNKKTLKARFYGIDTPESTGKVQPWGEKASKFTKEKLLAAKANGTIVVSSPTNEYGAPNPDSTGSRYVSLVWINETKKNAGLDELYLLNLWIVQEGFSLVKNITDLPEYEDSFHNAAQQAKIYAKNMWSGEDKDFNKGDYKEVSLLDIKREVELSIADQSHQNIYHNKKVTFTGVVSSYADGTLYVQEFYPIDDEHPTEGEWAGINIFCGMSVISSKFTKTNTYIRVFGLAVDSETFGFQITDTQGHWAAYAPEETDCVVLLKADENTEEHSLYTFHYTVEELNSVAKANNCESLFCSVSVSGELNCNYCYISDDRAITLGFSNTSWGIYIPFAYYGNPDDTADRWDEKTDFEGKTFRIDLGTYCWHRQQSGKVVYQILPTSGADFVCLG